MFKKANKKEKKKDGKKRKMKKEKERKEKGEDNASTCHQLLNNLTVHKSS